MNKMMIAAGALLAATAFAGAASAGTGCNGVISQMEWGCAAWDNNNGPQFPHWKGAPAGRAMPGSASLAPNALVASGGGNLVASGAGNMANKPNGLVASGAGNLVASGAGNARSK